MSGELVAQRNDDDTITVLRADPSILISPDLLTLWRSDISTPHITIDDDTIVITATNGEFRYLLTGESALGAGIRVAARLP